MGLTLMFSLLVLLDRQLTKFVVVQEKPPYEPDNLLRFLVGVYLVWLVYPLFPAVVADSLGQLAFAFTLLHLIIRADGSSIISSVMGWCLQKYSCGTSDFGAAAAVLCQIVAKHLVNHASWLRLQDEEKIKKEVR